jgi:hypothetical protein
LTPESESEFSGKASILSLRLRGFEDGGRGGKGLFNLAEAVDGEGFRSEVIEFGSRGGAFSLEDLALREGDCEGFVL